MPFSKITPGSAAQDNTTEPNIPYKSGTSFENSNLSQDPTGEIRATTQIIAEAGIDSPPATYISGDGMDISSSGPQQINRSRITDSRYQLPYQLIDKTGTGKLFTANANSETLNNPRQSLYDTELISPTTASIAVTQNEIINAFHIRTNGSVSNFRFQIKALPSNNVVLSYPDKFRYANNIGITLTGEGIHKLDLYYVDQAAPARFLSGQNLVLSASWENAGGTVLGNSANEPWYEIDIQEITIVEREAFTPALKTKLEGLSGAMYLGVYVDLTALQSAHPTANEGDIATVTNPNGNIFYWDGDSWEDSGTGYAGDMLKSVYDPSGKNADAFNMSNMIEGPTSKILTLSERSKISSLENLTLGGIPDDTTNDTLDLINHVLTVNQVTQTTDGAMIAEDKLKLDNITDNGVSDHWVSGLSVTEHDPKNQTVNYTSGTYLINGILKTVASGGIYDLENGYGSINHYTGLTSYQHRFVTLYTDVNEVIKSIDGPAADKKDVPDLPITPIDSVPIALIEIKVDSSAIPKDIDKKHITDVRNAPPFNTDEFVKASVDDQGAGYLIDKLSNNGNVTFTLENTGGIETIKADVSDGGGALPSITITADENIDGVDVSSLAPQGILYTNIIGNRELRSLQGGVDNQVIIVTNIAAATIKVKHETGTYQLIRTEGASDKTFGDYGGCTLVYNATAGYWFITGIVI